MPKHHHERAEPVRVLFICSRNQWRSPTAEVVAKCWQGVEARSGGTSQKARCEVGEKLLLWADVVIVMEKKHKERLAERFPDVMEECQVHVLDIPDEYQFMDPELVEWIDAAVPPLLERFRTSGG